MVPAGGDSDHTTTKPFVANPNDWMMETSVMFAPLPNTTLLKLWSEKMAQHHGFLDRNWYWAQLGGSMITTFPDPRRSPRRNIPDGTGVGHPEDPGYMANFALFSEALRQISPEHIKNHFVDLGSMLDRNTGPFGLWGFWESLGWKHPEEAMKLLASDEEPGKKYAAFVKDFFALKLTKHLREALLDKSLEIEKHSWWWGFGLSS